MDGKGEKLLAGAGISTYQHVDITLGRLGNEIQTSFDLRAATDNPFPVQEGGSPLLFSDLPVLKGPYQQ